MAWKVLSYSFLLHYPYVTLGPTTFYKCLWTPSLSDTQKVILGDLHPKAILDDRARHVNHLSLLLVTNMD